MIVIAVVLLSLFCSMQCAESTPKESQSDTSVYIPIGIDNIDINLEQLKIERRQIFSADTRRNFILLCEAAEKVFAGNPRVNEISTLKQQEINRPN